MKEDDSTFPWEGMHIVPVVVIQKKGCPEVVKASNNFCAGSVPECIQDVLEPGSNFQSRSSKKECQYLSIERTEPDPTFSVGNVRCPGSITANNRFLF